MTSRAKAARLFFSLTVTLALLWGCAEPGSLEVVSEQEDPVFRRARDLYARGMENEALENYLNLIQKRNGNAPESHLDAGNIYLNHLRDPVSAIYHFKRYEALLRRSDSEDAQARIGLVRDLIKSATKEFATTFDAKVYQDPLERLKLLDTIEALRSENEVLKRRLAEARTRLNQASESAVELRRESREPVAQAERPLAVTPVDRREPSPQAAPEARTYTIKPGDSLYRIARLAYGDSSRWREILEANRDVIPDETNLKVGTTIRIP